MAERCYWQRYSIGAAALLTGALLFWIALHCDGSDWYISQTHADIIYTGLRRFGEFPYFSFVFNGGSYFLQDPQSNLFSPAVPLILLAGPSVGLRLVEGLWGVVGVYAFVAWMRRRVSTEAALVGAVASVTSLGMLWKIAIGNDMFLWHLGLPIVLWAVDRVMSERTLQSALYFGLALGLLLLGPTFHSFTYLFLPAVPLFIALQWALHRPSRAEFRKTLWLFGLSCSVGLATVSPKLACWLKFPMGRPVGDFGAIPLLSGLRYLVDYGAANNHVVAATRFISKNKSGALLGWGVEECAVALPPLGTLFAVLGIGAFARSRSHRQLGSFALLLIVISLALTCSNPIWHGFRWLSAGNFRVAPRFLGMAAFGLAIFATLGAELVFSRVKRGALPIALSTVAVMLGSAVWWTHLAGSHYREKNGDTVATTAVDPIERFSEERDAASQLTTYTKVRRYRNRRDILSGVGYTDGFLVVGNAYHPTLWDAQRALPIVMSGVAPSQVSIENLRIKIRELPPRARVFLRAREPRYGMAVTSTPTSAAVNVTTWGNLLLVENKTDAIVPRVVIRAQLPISSFWLVLSGVALLGTLAALITLGVQGRRGSRAQLAPGGLPA